MSLQQSLRHHQIALLIGSDCPTLTVGHLHQARDRLRSVPVQIASSSRTREAQSGENMVFIPATDGGYVLVGATDPFIGVFEQMPWGSDKVMQLTRERLKMAGRSWSELAALNDVDRTEDLLDLPPGFEQFQQHAPKF